MKVGATGRLTGPLFAARAHSESARPGQERVSARLGLGG